ncbi:MAG: methylated-DNA--[protein]-cysteine S-methyltransferase [Burkholderiaceae bacterium]|nr:methylated-DNA--[protein]-cysteine S-methyltransferase [Burkholderiaceae bacterium]
MMATLNSTAFVAQAEIDTPLGPLTALATERGLAGLWFDVQKHHPGVLDTPVDAAHPHIAATRAWLAAYWAGRDTRTIGLALDPQGTPFQHKVWQALLKIRHGHTSTYGEIAAQAGRPEAARAAGAAIGRNPISIIVPCHRVIGRDGSLTGYAGGLQRKQALLKLEGVLLA